MVRSTTVTANLFRPARGQDKAVWRTAQWVKNKLGPYPDTINGQEPLQLLSPAAEAHLSRRYVTFGNRSASISLKKKLAKSAEVMILEGSESAAKSGPNRNPRDIIVLKYAKGRGKRRRKFADVNTHMPVVKEQELIGDEYKDMPPPGRAYVDQVNAVVKIVRELMAEGYIVRVHADGNTVAHTAWRFALINQLRAIGMTVFHTGLDLLAIFKGQHRHISARVIPKSIIGSDKHDGLAVSSWTK